MAAPDVEAIGFGQDGQRAALYHEDVKGKAVWLIKLPVGVDPAQLNGKKIAFKKDIAIGSRNFKATFDAAENTKLKVILPRKSDGTLVAGGNFQGQLSLCETVSVGAPTLPARLANSKVIVQPKELLYSLTAFGTHKQHASEGAQSTGNSLGGGQAAKPKPKPKAKAQDSGTKRKKKQKRKHSGDDAADQDILGKKMKKKKSKKDKKSKKKDAKSDA